MNTTQCGLDRKAASSFSVLLRERGEGEVETSARESVEYCLPQAKTCEYKGLRAKYRELCETFTDLACDWRKLANQIETLQREAVPANRASYLISRDVVHDPHKY